MQDKKTKFLIGLIGAKVLFLAFLWMAMDGTLTFGDKPLQAQDETVKGTEDKSKGNVTKAVTQPKPAEKKERKSFLANLLDLPPLNTEDMKKEELGKYIELINKKKQQVDERLDTLEQREGQLVQLESAIDEKLRLLDRERKFFAETIQKEKEVQADRLEKLITLYSKMEPKKAAPVIEKMDKDLVVSLFKVIPQKQITLILEQMNPDKSVELTEYYGRIRSAKEYDLLKEMNQSLRKEFDDCKGMPKQ